MADLGLQVVALEQNLGFGGGCNVGWRASTAPNVLFLNPDARISPDGVLSLAAALDRTGSRRRRPADPRRERRRRVVAAALPDRSLDLCPGGLRLPFLAAGDVDR